MKGAAEAIVRLQHTYKLGENAVASGKIPGLTTMAFEMTALDCYLLGYHQAQLGFHDYAIEWLQVALKKQEDEIRQKIPQKIERSQILDWLQHSVYHYGNVSRALRISEELVAIEPDFPNAKANVEFYKNIIQSMSREALESLHRAPPRTKAPAGHYEALCRGEGKLVSMHFERKSSYF